MTQVAKQIPAKVESKESVKSENPLQVLKSLKQPTAAERIKRAEQFELLAERFNLLTEKKTQLEKFLISDDGTQDCTLTLRSGNKTFDMANNAVIKEVLTFAKAKLNSLIETTEAEVLSFSI